MDRVIDELIAWLEAPAQSMAGLGLYCTSTTPSSRRIEQDLRELGEYATALRSLHPRAISLEVGFGSGGTHFVWSRLFDEVISIESDFSACCRGIVAFPQPTSTLLCGDSADPDTARTLERVLEGRDVDHLFIDGRHDYRFVRSDFMTYAPYVRTGGVIGFHDARWNGGDVGDLIRDLQGGALSTWPPVQFTEIYHGPSDYATGIAYFART